jgi:ABC-type ATPase with predicted acetyltransferase domain
LFGLRPGDARDQYAELLDAARRAARQLDNALQPGSIALVTGASGSGKSTILHVLQQQLGEHATTLPDLSVAREQPGTSVIDLIDGSLHGALGLLARAGLADATLLTLPPASLSDGQRWRLRLAIGMARCSNEHDAPASPRDSCDTLLIDEFTSPLDRVTARCVSRTLRKWVFSRCCVRVVCASAHDDVLAALTPDVLVAAQPNGEFRVIVRGESERERGASS